MALWGVIQGQNNRGSFRVIGSFRIMNWVVIQGRLGLQLTASCFGLPVRVSGTNLALARVRGWGKGSNYLKSSCVRGTAYSKLFLTDEGHSGSYMVIQGHPKISNGVSWGVRVIRGQNKSAFSRAIQGQKNTRVIQGRGVIQGHQ